MAKAVKPTADFARERALRRKGMWPVAGIDEVGCGPLAGPVCAAAVILDPGAIPEGLCDSKAMTAKAREVVFEKIVARALAVSFSFVTAAEIDAINIRRAALRAMAQAANGLSCRPSYALVDGRLLPELSCPGEAIVKGDALCASIAAASIVAKVARDGYMRRLAEEHPHYGFAANAGYATRAHLEALARFGPTPHHRMSFSPMRADGVQLDLLEDEA